MIIGQDEILNRISKLDIDSFPHSLMLLGDYGSGRHSIVKYISEHLNLEINDITNNLTLDTIDSITTKVYPSIYLINGDIISEKSENVILKFLEEPLNNAFIIIICSNKNYMLSTILNRCIIWDLKPYSKEDLLKFTNDENIIRFANTPGKVKELDGSNFDSMRELANKIYDKITVANISNTLTLANKINFKDEKDKFNFDIFSSILLEVAKIRYIMGNNIFYNVYNLTSKMINDSKVAHSNKKSLFENYLLDLKFILRT